MTRFNLSLFIAFLLILTGISFAQDSKAKLKSLPAAVQKTIKEQSEGATLKGVSKEKRAGKIAYEVETMVSGRSRDLIVAADGKVLEVEEEMTLDTVPAAVKATFEKLAGKGKIIKVESLSANNTISLYEAEVKINGKVREFKVSPEGKSLGK